MKIGIVMPAYNEEKRIGNTLREYSSYFEKKRKREKDFDYNLLVSVNNTKDSTLSIVKSYSKKNSRIIYINLVEGGKGYAIREGFKIFLGKGHDIIGFVDADMATSPEAYDDLIRQLKMYDGVIASRYLPGAIVKPKQSMQRIFVSRLYNYFLRAVLLMNFRDTQCGAKIFTKKLLSSVIPRLTMSKWAFDIDILYNAKKLGFIIKEHPTTWSDKDYSKINFLKAGPMMVLGVIRLRLINSPFKGIARAYDFLVTKIRLLSST